MTTATCTRPTGPPAALVEAVSRTVAYRIMRETEVAPSWWGIPREIGETVSVIVAHKFCEEQNAVTLDVNRPKRQFYFAEPVYAGGDV